MINFEEIEIEDGKLKDLPKNCLFLCEKCICRTFGTEFNDDYSHRSFHVFEYIDFENKRLNFKHAQFIFNDKRNKIHDIESKTLPKDTNIKIIKNWKVNLFPILDKNTGHLFYLIDVKNKLIFNGQEFLYRFDIKKKNFSNKCLVLNITEGSTRLEIFGKNDLNTCSVMNLFLDQIDFKFNDLQFLSFLNGANFIKNMDKKSRIIKQKLSAMSFPETYALELTSNIDSIKFLLATSSYYEILKVLRNLSNLIKTFVLENLIFKNWDISKNTYLNNKLCEIEAFEKFAKFELSKYDLFCLEYSWYHSYDDNYYGNRSNDATDESKNEDECGKDGERFLFDSHICGDDLNIIRNKIKKIIDFKKLNRSIKFYKISNLIISLVMNDIYSEGEDYSFTENVLWAKDLTNKGIHKSNYDDEPYKEMIIGNEDNDKLEKIFTIFTDLFLKTIDFVKTKKLFK